MQEGLHPIVITVYSLDPDMWIVQYLGVVHLQPGSALSRSEKTASPDSRLLQG